MTGKDDAVVAFRSAQRAYLGVEKLKKNVGVASHGRTVSPTRR
ncbi:MAG: hypothetical protein JWM55_1422 [Acidimicrobiaceae bacterium]|nr:hypothetical protein [Acidimicrobiaceae bacterium]